MTVKERLVRFIKYKNLPVNRFEKMCKLSTGYVGNMRTSIQPSKIMNIANIFPELNTGWLLTGEGEMLKEKERDGVIVITPEQIKETPRGTPIYDIDVTCGFDERDFQDEQIVGYIDLPSIRKNTHIVTATGDSMSPKVCDGDRLALREIDSWDIIFFGQIYLVVTENYRMLKYVRKHTTDDGSVILRSENDKYDDMIITKKDIVRLFAVENILSIKNLM